jgi:NAD(P)-dependent dehydrogenase (short-subunit alcohol dehydrogenase family)
VTDQPQAHQPGERDAGFDLSGRRALVTGASAGIGGAIALRLAQAGARVVAVSRSGRLPTDAAGLTPLGVLALASDLADPASLDTVVDRAVELLDGGLDIVVNNAGRADWVPLAEVDRAFFDDLVGLDLWAPLRICQLAHPHLAASDDAAVVMIGSIDAVRPSAGGAVYGAMKAALAAVTVALAKEWRDDAIRVTQVDPGLIDTPMAAPVVAQLTAEGFGTNLAGRAGTGDEIAALVHYLVAPVGRFANGTSFRVDGGALAMGPFDLRA